jgi:hypothetical protein
MTFIDIVSVPLVYGGARIRRRWRATAWENLRHCYENEGPLCDAGKLPIVCCASAGQEKASMKTIMDAAWRLRFRQGEDIEHTSSGSFLF